LFQRASDDQISNGNLMETDPNSDVKKVIEYLITRAHSFPWASLRNSAAYRGKIVQILWLATASCL